MLLLTPFSSSTQDYFSADSKCEGALLIVFWIDVALERIRSYSRDEGVALIAQCLVAIAKSSSSFREGVGQRIQ